MHKSVSRLHAELHLVAGEGGQRLIVKDLSKVCTFRMLRFHAILRPGLVGISVHLLFVFVISCEFLSINPSYYARMFNYSLMHLIHPGNVPRSIIITSLSL